MVAAKKMKKSLGAINSSLQPVMKSGKCAGIQAHSEDDQMGQSNAGDPLQQLLVLGKSEIECHAMLAKTGAHHYRSSNIELGTAFWKHYTLLSLAQVILILVETLQDRLFKVNQERFLFFK